jgi:protein TonB
MELKKKPELEINYYRKMFLMVGLIVSLGFALIVLEHQTPEELEKIKLADLVDSEVVEEVDIPQTQQELPPAVVQQPEIVEVPNEKQLVQDIEINLDIDMNQEIKLTSPIIQKEAATASVVEDEAKEEVFIIVEDQPKFEGGLDAFYKFVSDNLEYPKQAKFSGIEGKVFLQFIVEKDGSLGDIQVIKGIGGGCDEEAVRVVKASPKWQAGKQRGRPVKVKMSLPIFFKLVK